MIHPIIEYQVDRAAPEAGSGEARAQAAIERRGAFYKDVKFRA